MRIGVLALQGDVHEHRILLEKLDVTAVEVRTPVDLDVDGLIIPGGESTTLGKLMRLTGLDAAIRKRAAAGMPVFGTCAGLILLSQHVQESKQPTLGLIDISVERNAYGRQIESFETTITSKFAEKMSVTFIRAPIISSYGENVEILAHHNGVPILARQNNILVASFHPEITGATALHEYFISMVKSRETAVLQRT